MAPGIPQSSEPDSNGPEFHDLRNEDRASGINHVPGIVDRRLALDAGDDLQPVAVMLVAANRGFQTPRKGVKGVVHLRDQILERGVGDTAHEQIALVGLSRQKLRIAISSRYECP